jgi:hypothetical protein
VSTTSDNVGRTLTARSTYKIQPQSPFLRLSGELRNKIYEHLFSGLEIRRSYIKDEWPRHTVYYRRTDDSKGRWKSLPKHSTGLTSVCRQLHLETRYLVFSLDNEFSGQDKWCLHQLLDSLDDEQRKRIKRLRVILDRTNMQWDREGNMLGPRQIPIDMRALVLGEHELKRLVVEWRGETGNIG